MIGCEKYSALMASPAYAHVSYVRLHMDPPEAVRVHQDIKARRSLAIHWGTFANLTDESLYEPPLRLADPRRWITTVTNSGLI